MSVAEGKKRGDYDSESEARYARRHPDTIGNIAFLVIMSAIFIGVIAFFWPQIMAWRSQMTEGAVRTSVLGSDTVDEAGRYANIVVDAADRVDQEILEGKNAKALIDQRFPVQKEITAKEDEEDDAEVKGDEPDSDAKSPPSPVRPIVDTLLAGGSKDEPFYSSSWGLPQGCAEKEEAVGHRNWTICLGGVEGVSDEALMVMADQIYEAHARPDGTSDQSSGESTLDGNREVTWTIRPR